MAAIKNPADVTGLTRRELLQMLTTGAVVMGGQAAYPALASAAGAPISSRSEEQKLYADLLKTWCDGLVARQITEFRDPAFYGGLLCPACALIHGRCGDAVYPLLKMAHDTGEERYLRAAKGVHEWSQAQVSRPNGEWMNDVTLSTWAGITVFHAIALAEALHHHGDVLDAANRSAWTERLAKAAKFLDSFITIQTGNVNYPVTATLAFVLCGQVLGEDRYVQRGRKLAQRVLEQFTSDGFLFGEGHPLDGISPKGCRPVDLGYNIEESLPSLALYSLVVDDKPVQQQVLTALKTHMEFQLPDGAWDNSWGTRNYKWTWWGSRTSDGCHPGFVLMADHDLRFREVARRNAELMQKCTHEGLLYGGPHYQLHGDLPCIHHTFTHAKAIATVLDRGTFPAAAGRPRLPRDTPYGLKSFPVIGTRLAAVGPWRATVTEYDWEYREEVQKGGGESRGGHVSGGALSQLFHMKLGPILVASMTKYEMIEISNQQQYRNDVHMPLTPRIEYRRDKTYTNLNDYKAVLTVQNQNGEAVFDAQGELLTAGHEAVFAGAGRYQVRYQLTETQVKLSARATGLPDGNGSLRFLIPVIAKRVEAVEQVNPHEFRIARAAGRLIVRTDGAGGFLPVPSERTFNLVPGFEAVPIAVAMGPDQEVNVVIETDRD